ncbi:CapA family protein [bacterium]|nr:CapA family protein [bacterium]
MKFFHQAQIFENEETIDRAKMKKRYPASFWIGITGFFLLGICAPLHTQDLLKELLEPHQAGDSLTLAVVGDIMVHQAQLVSAWNPETQAYDFDPVFAPVRKLLSGSDLTIGNLETTLPGRKDLFAGYPRFGAPDALARALQKAGFDILATANNHACDKGLLGLTRTLDVLDSLGIRHTGTWRDSADRDTSEVLVVKKKDFRLAFLNFTYDINGMPVPAPAQINLIRRKVLSDQMALARSLEPDMILVLLHCGTEYGFEPDDFQKKTVDFLFKEGADIILGSHPHVLQRFDRETSADRTGTVKPRFVIYSLGNFLSNQRERRRNGGIVLHLTLKKTSNDPDGLRAMIASVDYTPVWVDASQTKGVLRHRILPLAKETAGLFLSTLNPESRRAAEIFLSDTHTLLRPHLIEVRRDIEAPRSGQQSVKRKPNPSYAPGKRESNP